MRNIKEAGFSDNKTFLSDADVLESLMDKTDDAIYFKDRRSRFVKVNHAAANLLGLCSPEEAIGKSDFDFFSKEHAKKTFKDEKDIIQSAKPLINIIEKETFSGKIKRYVSTSKFPLLDKNQKIIGTFGISRDVTVLINENKMLREGEIKNKAKLEAIFAPEVDIADLELSDILDIDQIRPILEDFYKISGIGIGLIDIKGRELLIIGRQDICLHFHRANPQSRQNCIESDTLLSRDVEPGAFKEYRCKNNLWDIVTPIHIGNRLMGNIFIGQFFYTDEKPDYEIFRNQAKKFGFDEADYLEALERTPRWSREKVANVMRFYARMASMISVLNYSKLMLARALEDKKRTEIALKESELKYRLIAENISDVVWTADMDFNITYISNSAKRLFKEMPDTYRSRSMEKKFPLDSLKKIKKIFLEEMEKEKDPQSDKERSSFIEVEHYCADGSKVWVMMHVSFIRDQNGKAVGLQGVTRDITEKKKAEILLEKKLQFKKMLSDISTNFISLSFEKIDQGIQYAIKKAGKFFRAERSYLFQLSPDAKILFNTHKWCAKRVDSCTGSMNDLKLDALPWFSEKIKNREHFYVIDVQDLPKKASVEKSILASQFGQSFLIIPIMIGGTLFGFFGSDVSQKKRAWSEDEISLLKLLTVTMSNAIAKYQMEKETRLAHERLLIVLNSIGSLIYVADMKTYEILFINNYGKMNWGDIVGKKCWQTLYKDQKSPCEFCTNDKLIDENGNPAGAYHWEKFNSYNDRWYECHDTALRWVDGRIVRLETATDITERKQAELKIFYMSFHDSLTGLYNRLYMEMEMKRLNTKRQLPISIILADLNGLKLVNDSYGHAAGDKMLEKVAAILKKTCRKEDIIARWGGDEFIILLPQTSKQKAEVLCDRINENCSKVYLKDIPVSLALGSSTKQEGAIEIEDLFKKAEDNMYRHKLSETRSARSAIIHALLETLKAKSFETEAHVAKMQSLALKIGRELLLSESDLRRLDLLVKLHDIGKISIPEKILRKKSPLFDHEWKIIKEHPHTGYRIAMATPEFSYLAEDILMHHEHWDGRGYPRGIQGEAIPLCSRILAIVDAFEVMRNGRSYKKPMSKKNAVEELKRCAGTQFDPMIVDKFIQIL